MPPALHNANLTEKLSEILTRQIESGERAPGSRLPTEEQLAAEYGVSRTVIREGIARLKSDGLVTTRQGLGAFVAETLTAAPFRIMAGAETPQQTVQQVFELRIGVETQAAALAAERATATQLREIRTALKELEHVQKHGGDGVEEDMRFHRAIARATNNRVYDDFTRFLERHVREQLGISRGNSSIAGWLQAVQQEHQAIYDAIAARDSEAAAKAARAHLRNGMERLRKFHAH
ncbi:MAG TPA: FadR/GntR family transcriptional regulator [Bordetella sp.]|jgi:DNA-binding FadR family transcriptional regulator|nr:FadR/GntR family transcriptional regulator [Bordetella sp.]